MIVKTDAIVLRARNLRETSRFLTLYTAAFGKIDVVAKGVRTAKSKLRGVLEPFNELSAVLYRKEQRSVQYLSDAELLRGRPGIATHYDRLTAAFAVAELADTTMHHEEPNPAMYALLRVTLDGIDGDDDANVLFLRFQIGLIHLLGFSIRTSHCAQCGATLSPDGVRWFSVAEGGVRCGACGRGASGGTNLSGEAYTLLNSIVNGDREIAPPVADFRAAARELRGLLNAYILHHTESRAVLRAGAMYRGETQTP